LRIAFLAAILLVGAVTIGLILARLYQRASKDRAFVRTGLGGQKVVMDGGAVCLPVSHELIWVNMNTLKLEVHRSGADSLFTKDRMRVDVIVAFSCAAFRPSRASPTRRKRWVRERWIRRP
jgi:uncharacterized membrane protein YqiK